MAKHQQLRRDATKEPSGATSKRKRSGVITAKSRVGGGGVRTQQQ